MYTVLSLDIDFFLTRKPTGRAPEDGRLPEKSESPDEGFETDPLDIVQKFLEKRCQLSEEHKARGVIIRDHVDAYPVLEKLSNEHGQVRLVHVDAHADLGDGSPGVEYLMTSWFHKDEVQSPTRGYSEMNLGNWLAFAAAAGFLHEIEFVPRGFPPPDLHPAYLEPPPPAPTTSLAFRRVARGDLTVQSGAHDPYPSLRKVAAERVVPWSATDADLFEMSKEPDFVILCQSPQFTPPSADRALEFAARYVECVDLGLELPPIAD